MIDLTIFFENPISTTIASFEDKKLGSEAIIGKTTAQNTNHQYDQMLADTISAHTAFFGDITDVALKLAIQKMQTKIVDNIIEDFCSRTSRLNSYFISTKFNLSPAYIVFFPQGVQEITEKTNKGNIETHISILVDAITAHTAEAGGAGVLTEYQNFKTNYAVSRLLQTTKIGDTKGARSTREEAEAVWENQIFDNLLTLAKLFKGQPKKLDDFFSQQYFHTNKDTADTHKGQLKGNITRAGTNLAEPDVKVHLVDADVKDFYSNPEGVYQSPKTKSGFYKARFIKPGFVTQEHNIEIKSHGEITTLNVVMVLA
ncbi:MAG: hypothetical protein WCH34_13620 [Bacteroidota bacterium]